MTGFLVSIVSFSSCWASPSSSGPPVPAFLTASCFNRQQTPAELKATENLRSQTRRGQLPAEEVLARMESEFARTKAAGIGAHGARPNQDSRQRLRGSCHAARHEWDS